MTTMDKPAKRQERDAKFCGALAGSESREQLLAITKTFEGFLNDKADEFVSLTDDELAGFKDSCASMIAKAEGEMFLRRMQRRRLRKPKSSGAKYEGRNEEL